jgi:hypothetical protein
MKSGALPACRNRRCLVPLSTGERSSVCVLFRAGIVYRSDRCDAALLVDRPAVFVIAALIWLIPDRRIEKQLTM